MLVKIESIAFNIKNRKKMGPIITSFQYFNISLRKLLKSRKNKICDN